MSEIYKQVFNNNIIKINDLTNIDYSSFGNDNICIMQPHNGGREVKHQIGYIRIGVLSYGC